MLASFLLCDTKVIIGISFDDHGMLRQITCFVLLSTALSAPVKGEHPVRLAVLPLPDTIHDGDTIRLRCGLRYIGTLDLRGRSDVVLHTEGDCGKATVTPAQPIHGWQREGPVWSAAISEEPLMVQIDDQFISLAHHPNGQDAWLSGEGTAPDRLRVTVPNHDLVGATVVWRPEDWLILSQRVGGYEGGQLRIVSVPEPDFGFRERTPYYLEGQRWMLDAPGEWVFDHGRLYLWPPDGRSPEGRVWAAPRATAIDARSTRNVRIQGVRISLAARGIDGSNTQSLTIADTEIINSFDEAIRVGGTGAHISRVQVLGTRQHGLRAEDDARDVSVTHSVFERIGMLGMPLRSKGAIVFEQARGQLIIHNRIDQSAYLGIRVFRDAVVTDNVITRACQRLSDCGGIYTFARDKQPLFSRIERNRVSDLRGRLSHAIYLDDFANAVIIRDNRLSNNPGGVQLHDAFNNLIANNHFSRSAHEHLLFNETASSHTITANRIIGNRFVLATGVPAYRLWSRHGGAHVLRFASFEKNCYEGPLNRLAQLEGIGWLDAAAWRKTMDEPDPHCLASTAPPQLTRQPKQK